MLLPKGTVIGVKVRSTGARVGVPEGKIEVCWLGAIDGFSFVGALDELSEGVKVGMPVGEVEKRVDD